MKYYQKPQVVIEESKWEYFVLAGSERQQYGGTRDNEDGGLIIPNNVVDNSTIDYDPYSNGQGYGTNRSNTGLWDE